MNRIENSKIKRYRELIVGAFERVITGDFLLMLFGSFSRGKADRLSDIDVGVYAGRSLSPREYFELKCALEELPILRDVDLVDLAEVENPEFLEEVLRGKIWKSSPELLRDLKRRLRNLRK